MWRSFSDHVEKLAGECEGSVLTTEGFIVNGTPAGGGTTAVPILMQASGLRAFAKPARPDPDGAACAAREKIASDIAYNLGLPVAPVILSNTTNGTSLPPLVCISYSALAQPRPWNQITLTEDEMNSLRPGLAALFAFHTWLDDHDHNWNDGNVLLERGTDNIVRMVSIDYSFSLNKAWNPPEPAPIRQWKTRSGPYSKTDMTALEAAVGKIEKYPEDKIRATISKIPHEFLSPTTGEALVTGLLARRHEIRNLLF